MTVHIAVEFKDLRRGVLCRARKFEAVAKFVEDATCRECKRRWKTILQKVDPCSDCVRQTLDREYPKETT